VYFVHAKGLFSLKFVSRSISYGLFVYFMSMDSIGQTGHTFLIPGGVVSGTALIRPDFPELLVFPYLWQQVEYVLCGGSSHYMFLVLATMDLLQ
jgi:hypothetical protein